MTPTTDQVYFSQGHTKISEMTLSGVNKTIYMYIGRVPCLSAAKFSQNYAQVRVMCLQPSKQVYQEVCFFF
jgi:hypothetical protein